MNVAQDKVVSFTYTLRVAGEVIDEGDLSYIHGHEQIVPGLEEALVGSASGAKLKVAVPPAKGYGDRDPERIQVVPRSAFPDGAPLSVGAQLHAEDSEGNPLRMTVLAMGDKEVKLDFNHPLAGATLDFEVAVTEVRAATAEELEHGHVHGADGHDHDHDHDDDHDHDHDHGSGHHHH